MSFLLAYFFSVTMTIYASDKSNWYRNSFYLLHEDHHTHGDWRVGRDADSKRTAKLIRLSRPDVIQIHAKGNPGWTTYPTDIGYTPRKLACDVLRVWRDIANRDGYHFSVYYNIGRDGQIMKHTPQWNRVKANGELYVKKLCYHSGVAEQYLWPMIKEIIRKYHPDGFWFDGSCFTVDVCYCEKCRERFRKQYLGEVPKDSSSPCWVEYREMQRQIYREFVHDTAAMVHKIDKNCLVAFNWAYSLRMPEKPDENIDYLTGDIRNRVEGLSAEAHWYDSQNRPFDLMTRVYAPPEGPKPPGQIKQEMAIIIANGGRYFAWDNPTRQTGLDPIRMEFLGDVVAPFLRKRQKWCLNFKRVPDVSLLHSSAAHYAATSSSIHCFERGDSRIDSASKELFKLHLNYEMVPDWRLKKQDIKSPVLIVEHPAALTEETIQSLCKYVSSGGTLLLTGMGITQSADMLKLCGLKEVVKPNQPEEILVSGLQSPMWTYDWLYRTKAGQGKVHLFAKDREDKQYPFLVRNHFGQGQVFYVAIPLLTAQPPLPLVLNEDFEEMPALAKPPLAHVQTEGKKNLIEVTDETAVSGQHSLKIQDAPGLKHKYNPHFYYRPHHKDGVTHCSFDMRIEEDVVMYHEWRDKLGLDHRVGPSFFLREGSLQVWDKELLKLPEGEWVHFEIKAGVGKNSTGSWNLTVTIPGEQPHHFRDLKNGNKDWKTLNWLGFSSMRKKKTVFYLDNIRITNDTAQRIHSSIEESAENGNSKLIKSVMDTVLPPKCRWVTTEEADTVEVVLRRRDDTFILHLVNRAPGEQSGTKREPRITDIPPVPSCKVSVRLPSYPQAVHLEPSGKRLHGWSFTGGRLEAEIPSFEIHQMLLMELPSQESKEADERLFRK